MSRSKSLLSNTIIFALTNLVTKFLGFLMLPLYTSVLSREELGTADIINTTVALLTPLLTLNIVNASMRFALDKSQDAKQVFIISFKIIMYGFVFLLLLSPFFYSIQIFKSYIILFYLLYITSVIYIFLSLFLRGVDKIKIIGIASIFNSLGFVFANIILLYYLRMKVDGFLIALMIGNTVGILTLIVGGKVCKYFTVKKNNKILQKEMINYSLPLVPNSLGWFVNHTSSRYFIGLFRGVSDVGLFAAAIRMPSILIALQSVFSQAWQISAITEYDKEDNIPFFSKIYTYYSISMVLACSVLIIGTKYIAKFLFAEEFYEAWIYTPLLLVSVVFGAMVGFYSAFYLAHKKTKILFRSTLTGAIVTIVLNIILIPCIGLMGSAIANTLAYFCIWLYLHLDSKKFLELHVVFHKQYKIYLILTVQAIFAIVMPEDLYLVSVIFCLLVILYLVSFDIRYMVKDFLRIFNNKIIS